MTSEKLQKARDFEAQYGPHIPDGQRPAFHASPTIGWMNDPNGFSFYRGECHLFYQYHPYSNEWGPMHWGHLKTRDFIRWERLPAALAPDEKYDAAGCFSGGAVELPDGRLIQNPVRELESYRGSRVVHQNIPVCGEINLPGVQGRVLDMTLTVRPIGSDRYRWFRIRVAKDGAHETIIRYRPDQGTLKLDRTRSGLPHDIIHTRSLLVRPRDGEIKLRIILDRFSVEVFVNDGEQAASAVIYTHQEADAITFEAGGSALMDVEKYDLIFDNWKGQSV